VWHLFLPPLFALNLDYLFDRRKLDVFKLAKPNTGLPDARLGE
jgi:hypothetical protein